MGNIGEEYTEKDIAIELMISKVIIHDSLEHIEFDLIEVLKRQCRLLNTSVKVDNIDSVGTERIRYESSGDGHHQEQYCTSE